MLIQHRQSTHRPSTRLPDPTRYAEDQYTGWEEDDKPKLALAPKLNPRKTDTKRKGKERTSTANSKAALEDELLDLVEGEEGRGASASAGVGGGGTSTAGGAGGGVGASSPHPYSDDDDDDDEDTESNLADRFDPDVVVQPSGLTRREIITKIEKGQMQGLTEADVKAVQDEMWLREKVGSAPTNKDGTVRRKPGPAKGWKKLRGGDYDETRSDGGTSVGDGTINGEAEAEIAALLGDDDGDSLSLPQPLPHSTNGGEKKKRPRPSGVGKKRKVDELADDTRNPEGSELDSEDERLLLGDSGAPTGSRGGRIKEPGVGKGRWTRPIRPADSKVETEIEPDQSLSFETSLEMQQQQLQSTTIHPNSYDPRGVSEVEARLRLDLVEELERNIWASICRDIPRVGHHHTQLFLA